MNLGTGTHWRRTESNRQCRYRHEYASGRAESNTGGSANSDSLLIGNGTTKGLMLRDNGTAVDIESIGVDLFLNNGGNATHP